MIYSILRYAGITILAMAVLACAGTGPATDEPETKTRDLPGIAADDALPTDNAPAGKIPSETGPEKTRPLPPPAPQPAPEPMDAADPEPAPEPAPEPKPALQPEPAPVSAPEPATEPQPAPQPTPERAPEPTSAPEPESEPAPEPMPAAVAPPPEPATEPETAAADDLAGASRLISGQVSLAGDDIDAEERSQVVVYFVPDGQYEPAPPRSDYRIVTARKRFNPSVLAVPVGSTVSFPNNDTILHNVFSVTPGANFDLGLYGQGDSREVTFDQPGLVLVHCNVHHAMQADILVLDTPYFTTVDATGNFSLEVAPDRSGTLYMWHPRGKVAQRSLAAAAAPVAIDQTLELVRPRVPPHNNKFGESYRPTRPGSQ